MKTNIKILDFSIFYHIPRLNVFNYRQILHFFSRIERLDEQDGAETHELPFVRLLNKQFMKIVINFLLRKNRESADNKFPVYVRFTLKNKRVELSIGIFIPKDHWDESKQRIKEKISGARVSNDRLNKMKTEIQNIFNQLRSSSEVFDATTIKNRLLNTKGSKGVLFVFDYYLNSILAKLNKGYSMETYKHYKSSRKRLSNN